MKDEQEKQLSLFILHPSSFILSESFILLLDGADVWAALAEQLINDVADELIDLQEGHGLFLVLFQEAVGLEGALLDAQELGTDAACALAAALGQAVWGLPLALDVPAQPLRGQAAERHSPDQLLRSLQDEVYQQGQPPNQQSYPLGNQVDDVTKPLEDWQQGLE